MTLADRLRAGEPIAVHGAGFVGTSTCLYYAQAGIRSLIFDTNKAKVDTYRRGECDVHGLERWSGLVLKPLVDEGLVTPVDEFAKLAAAPVHFIAVPTHRGDDVTEPYEGYLDEAVAAIAGLERKPALIVVESTIPPAAVDRLVARVKEMQGALEMPGICISPRRDWFGKRDDDLVHMPRVYWAEDLMERDAHAVLSIVCAHLHRASTAFLAALTKAAENSLYHTQIAWAQEMALAFPDTDVRELLELIATHPHRPRIYPSIHVGGYCVVYGSRATVAAADVPESLDVIEAALAVNDWGPDAICDNSLTGKRVLILGATYRNDLKVDAQSAARAVIQRARRQQAGTALSLHDPFYTDYEISTCFGIDSAHFPDALTHAEVILVLTDHALYRRVPRETLLAQIKPGTVVFDNLNAWGEHREALLAAGIKYVRPGDAGWLRW